MVDHMMIHLMSKDNFTGHVPFHSDGTESTIVFRTVGFIIDPTFFEDLVSNIFLANKLRLKKSLRGESNAIPC